MKPILIVDDDPAVCKIVVNSLKRHGYEVAGVSSGSECLERMRRGFRGLIFMDILMPGLSGWQTIRAINEENLLQGSVVCMLTGVLAPNEEADGLQELVLDYLTKPFTPASLLKMTEDAMAVLGG